MGEAVGLGDAIRGDALMAKRSSVRVPVLSKDTSYVTLRAFHDRCIRSLYDNDGARYTYRGRYFISHADLHRRWRDSDSAVWDRCGR